jgi:phage protein D
VIQADVYVPDFALTLGGRPFPADLRASVTAVRFEEALQGASRVEVQLANPGLRLLDRADLELEAPLRLSLGYRPANVREVFSGEITGVEPELPSSGMPTVTVTAHDATHRLSTGQKERAFPYYIGDSAIAAIVAVENGLIPRSDLATVAVGGLGIFTERPRYQHKQSDYELLRQIACEYGFDLWVDGAFLNFRLPLRELPPAEIELRWGQSLLEFAPRLTSIGQLASVRVSLWVEALRTQLAVEVRWDGERLGMRVIPALFGEQEQPVEATLSIPDLAADTPVDAIRTALGEMRRRLNSRVTASGSAIGDPRFRAGNVIGITGVGRRFSGRNYRLTSVAHSLDGGGYRTRFQVRQEVI